MCVSAHGWVGGRVGGRVGGWAGGWVGGFWASVCVGACRQGQVSREASGLDGEQ